MENLKQVVSRLSAVFLPNAVRHQSFFLKDVPADISIESSPQYITPVMSRLIAAMVRHVSEACIRFTARKQGHVIVLEMHETGHVDGFAMASELQQVNALAETIGGRLSIAIPRSKTTSIAFSFPDNR